MYSQDLTIKDLIQFIAKNRPEENKTPIKTILLNATIRIDHDGIMVKLPDLGIEVSAGAIKKSLGYLD